MFKYKSPLSRLLEGAGKPKEENGETETDIETVAEAQPEQPEPIADFNALRAALAGGNVSPESYEETDDLIPEDQMPEFEDSEVEDTAEAEEETSVDEADVEDDQIVTLHLTPADAVDPQQDVLAAVAEEVTTEPEVVEVQAEPAPVEEPEIVAETPAPDPMPIVEPAPEFEAIAQPAAPKEDRSARVKTTFLGFERADTHVQDLIETAEPVAKSEAVQQTFPVGWLVVTGGPGRGASITLTEGLMQIGRNDDQAIQLDFGDTGISRSSHAVIAYDPEDRKCYLGHGGKANLVRLNGKPVLSTVPLSSGDLIRISETSIRFTSFCDEGFDWRDAD
ncbi:MAG: FHA domain-containing protein [Ruegeria sp.]